MTDLWINKTIPLKYLLGEIPLFKISSPALIFGGHFTMLSTGLNEQTLPLERLSSNIEAVLIRSHPIEENLPKYSVSKKFIRYVPAQYQRYFIDLSGTFGDYLAKFSSKSRSTLQRKVRKFADISGGDVTWKEYKRSDEMNEYFRFAREVSEKTYQERLLDAGLPLSDDFVAEMIGLATLDSVRGYILFHDNKPIAYLYSPIENNILLYKYLGFDPAFKQYSPGTVLQYLVLERLFAEDKYKMFDFTEGQGPHKEFFSTGSKLCADVYYFRPTIKNKTLVNSHLILNSFTQLLVKTLDEIGLKKRIKKLIRSS